jgi:hypothetical protein
MKHMKALLKGAEIIGEKGIQFDSLGGNDLETPVDEIENWISKL